VRHIPPDVVRAALPVGWEARAQEATDAVAAAQPEERAAEIKGRSAVWQELKATLKAVSHNKCWYCESVDARSDNAVDHYRPKSAVAECTDHDGYWWLAFRWDNYRFCCTFCNCQRVHHETGTVGGKADHFPLKDERRRARNPADDLADEEPLLLDPTEPADPGFLWFDETGQAVPHPELCGDPDGYSALRASRSVSLYHLNHKDIVERRRAVCLNIRRRLTTATRCFRRYDAGDRAAREAFEDNMRILQRLLAADAEYSATARCMLMGLRGAHPVVDAVLAST
jgi:uncharacterized protein (TIGR02646 family)